MPIQGHFVRGARERLAQRDLCPGVRAHPAYMGQETDGALPFSLFAKLCCQWQWLFLAPSDYQRPHQRPKTGLHQGGCLILQQPLNPYPPILPRRLGFGHKEKRSCRKPDVIPHPPFQMKTVLLNLGAKEAGQCLSTKTEKRWNKPSSTLHRDKPTK